MIHSATDIGNLAAMPEGGLGFVGKSVRFIGKEAHAATPHLGVNALNAAMAALLCINSLRETFRDEDNVRVHPILTKGGDLVNVVPADVRMETYVRAANEGAIQSANIAVTRAIKGACYAIGAEAEIKDFPGYVPLRQNPVLKKLFSENAISLVGEKAFISDPPGFSGSTDAGDLGRVIPVLQPVTGGFSGAAHSENFRVADDEWAYVIPAKLLAMLVIDLLADGAESAEQIKRDYPRNTIASFEKMWTDMMGR